MGVETREHALDGVFQQGAVVYLVDVARPDLVVDIGEGAQFFQGQLALCFIRQQLRGRGLQGQPRDSSEQESSQWC